MAHVDAVGTDIEREVRAVVEDEGDVVVTAHLECETRSCQQRSGLERLLAQLDDVDPAADAGDEKARQVRPIGAAQIEAPSAETLGRRCDDGARQDGAECSDRAACSARALALMARLCSRTFTSDSGPSMSATDM